MKKYNIFKRVICGTLVTMMICTVGACSKEEKAAVVIEPMEKEEVVAYTIDFIGGKDVMPISGFGGPSLQEYSVDGVSVPDYLTDEMYQKIVDCGLNITHVGKVNWAVEPDLTIKQLELGEKYGLGIFVYDSQVCERKGENALSVKEMDARINNYSDYPAFCGMYVVDEPATTYYWPTLVDQREVSDYVPIFQNLKTLGVAGSGNLIPLHHDYDTEDYKRYVEEYVSTCEPPYLSWDYYVWDPEEYVTEAGYFKNMDIIRHYAEKYNIPFWAYVQAGGQWGGGFDSGHYFPDEGQTHWNINTVLAYGAKGIEYFPLIQPVSFSVANETEYDFHRNSLIGAWGNKTRWWHYAKDINAQIAAVDHVLMNSVNKGVIVSGKKAVEDTKGLEYIMKGTSWRELAGVDGNAMIGCFNYEGKTALYVVNYETEYAQKVTLNLHDSYKMCVTQKTEESRVKTDKLTLDMKAGEGVLVVFE